ncbi:hypothetical protein [Longirhabdus pacifica]|uniref:hypothetical protein n=1 Tax=Longirhabdus pacifica TaxID=2305227 RepID=UPI0010090AD0|nr:hypothetical protein [Longirhabdus pacifica]
MKKTMVMLLSLTLIFSMSSTVFAEDKAIEATSMEQSQVRSGTVEVSMADLASFSGSKEYSAGTINGFFRGTDKICQADPKIVNVTSLGIPDNAKVSAIKVTASRTGVVNYTYNYRLQVANELDGIYPKYSSVEMPSSSRQYGTINTFNGAPVIDTWFVSFTCERIFTNQFTGATVKDFKLLIEYTY